MARCAHSAVLVAVVCVATACDLARVVGLGDAEVSVELRFDPALYDPARNPIAKVTTSSFAGLGDYWYQDLTTDSLSFHLSLEGEDDDGDGKPDVIRQLVLFKKLQPTREVLHFGALAPGNYTLGIWAMEIVLPAHIRFTAPYPKTPESSSGSPEFMLNTESGDVMVPIYVERTGNGPCFPDVGCFPECHARIPGC